MRIRSAWTESTIYGRRREPQKRQGMGFSQSPLRKLMRMFVMLVLVMLLMQQASDPQVYRNFFAALGTPLDGQSQVQRRLPQVPVTPAGNIEIPTLPDGRTLDREAISQVSEATIWHPEDREVFYALLGLAQKQDYRSLGDSPQVVGYVSLADQASYYRGTVVTLVGQAVRCEPQRAQANAAGVEDYWLVWLRPLDGSDRPVMVYTPTLPPELQSITQTSIEANGPEVQATGVYLRRHLYAAQKGSQLAPVIVGHLDPIVPLTSVSDVTQPAPPVVPGSRLWQVVGGALALAAVVTTFIVWRTLQFNRHQRAMRKRAQGDKLAEFVPSERAVPSQPMTPSEGNQ